MIHLAIVSSAFITPFNLLIDNDKPGYNFYTTSYKTTSNALLNKLEGTQIFATLGSNLDSESKLCSDESQSG